MASLAIIASAGGMADTVLAQPGLTVGANVIFYGDNTEFRNPFREGETIFGAAARLDGRVEITDAVALSLGVFGNQRFGSEDAFELVRPILAITVSGTRSTFVFGTLPPRFELPEARRLPGRAGPDRAGPHGLLPPLQRETLAFERPYEAGLRWTFTGERLDHEAWLNWQRLNTAEHRERLDAGAGGAWRLHGPVSLPFQAHIVHEGGQLFAAGPVRDSVAIASGLRLSNRHATAPGERSASAGKDIVGTLELLGLWSRYTPDRDTPDRTRNGGAFFGRAAAETRGWRAHLIMWRGDDFTKDEGDSNYMSLRRDGTRYRGVRDYAEAGLTRTFTLAPTARIETSFRLHRIERHYEYSYRLLAVADVRARVK
ncbi:MAG: hypothetical protein ACRD15_19725 [Vicinamibacterales bacterium]